MVMFVQAAFWRGQFSHARNMEANWGNLMRGHGKIIEMRLAGKKPPFVFVNDYPCKTDWFEVDDHATVSTHGDSVSSLDMRFLFGLKVSICATSESRAKALFEAAKRAGAAVVAASHTFPVNPHRCESGWTEIWHKEVA